MNSYKTIQIDEVVNLNIYISTNTLPRNKEEAIIMFSKEGYNIKGTNTPNEYILTVYGVSVQHIQTISDIVNL